MDTISKVKNKCRASSCDNNRAKNGSIYCESHYYHIIQKVNKPLYLTWKNMKQRCYNHENKSYKNYGARGIKICQRWLDSYDNFVADMGDKPQGHSIDRINNDGDYEPDNCRWSNYTQQNYNQRKQSNNKSGVCGVYKIGNSWRAGIYFKRKYINLGNYKLLSDAKNARLNYEKRLKI